MACVLQDAGVSHQLTFAARAWRDSDGAAAGEVLVLFEPRAAANTTGACPYEACYIFLRDLDHRVCVVSVPPGSACCACSRLCCVSLLLAHPLMLCEPCAVLADAGVCQPGSHATHMLRPLAASTRGVGAGTRLSLYPCIQSAKRISRVYLSRELMSCASAVSAHACSPACNAAEKCVAVLDCGLQEHLVAWVALIPMQRLLAQRSLSFVDDAYRLYCTCALSFDGALLTAAWVRAAGPMRESLCGSAALPALEAVRVLGAAPAPGLAAALEVLDERALRGAPGPAQALPAVRQAVLAPLQARPSLEKRLEILACSVGLFNAGAWPP